MQRIEEGLYGIANRAMDLYNSPMQQGGTKNPALGTNQNWNFNYAGTAPAGTSFSPAPQGYQAPAGGTNSSVSSTGGSIGPTNSRVGPAPTGMQTQQSWTDTPKSSNVGETWMNNDAAKNFQLAGTGGIGSSGTTMYDPKTFEYFNSASQGAGPFASLTGGGKIQQGYDMSAFDQFKLRDNQMQTGGQYVGDNWQASKNAPPGYTLDPITGNYYPDWAFAQAMGVGQQQAAPDVNNQPAQPSGPTLMDTLMQDALNKQLAGSERYDVLTGQAGQLSDGALNALQQSETAGDWYFDQAKGAYGNADAALGNAGGMFQNSANAIAKGEGYFDGAIAAGEPWYNDAKASYGKSDSLIDQQVDQLNYTKEGNAWYDQFVREQLGQAANMTTTGEIPAAMEEAIMGSMNRMLEQSIGQQMNSMAGSGTINSSVNSSIMNNLANQAANAYQDNYMDTWNSVHGGILGNANSGIAGGDTFGRTNLNIASGYGDAAGNARLLGDSYANTGNLRVNNMLDTGNSFVNAGNAYTNTGNGYVNQGRGYTDLGNGLMTAGSGRINDWLNINKGYNDTSAQNLAEREYLNNAVPQYWQNALGPFSMVPGFLQQMQNDFANTGRQTTVVS